MRRVRGTSQKMAMPFHVFAGGPVGSGRQWLSWIHRDDWIRLVERAIADESIAGPLNAVSPQPVTNRAFSQALGRALHRPSWLPVPGLALQLLLGELADVALLQGQRVRPARAEQLGFAFTYRDVDRALAAALGATRRTPRTSFSHDE